MLTLYNYDIVCQEIPDEVTLALNLAGCPNRCEGCHSPWLWRPTEHTLDETLLSEIIGRYGTSVTCVGFMGGDGDPVEVERLARYIRSRFPHLKCGWYSGCDRLDERIEPTAFDYLKIGSYQHERGGLRSLTTNQHLYRVAAQGEWVEIFLNGK